MFNKKKEAPKLVGASAKFAAVERMKRAAALERQRGAKAKASSQTIPVTIIFVLAVGVSMLLLGPTSISKAGGFSIGQLLFASAAPGLTGDADIDRLIAILARGLAVFIVSAIAPLCGYVVVQASKKRLNPFIACWAVLLALPLVSYSFSDTLMPFIRSLMLYPYG